MLVNVLFFSILVAALGLWAWRIRDHRADRAAVHQLAATQPAAPACFDPAMVADLPLSARVTSGCRWMRIAPASPCATAVSSSRSTSRWRRMGVRSRSDLNDGAMPIPRRFIDCGRLAAPSRRSAMMAGPGILHVIIRGIEGQKSSQHP